MYYSYDVDNDLTHHRLSIRHGLSLSLTSGLSLSPSLNLGISPILSLTTGPSRLGLLSI